VSEAGARIRSGASLALAGAVSLFVALAAHEVLSFGTFGHGLIDRASCEMSLCPTLSVVIAGLAFKSIGAGLALGFLALLVADDPARRSAAILLWLMQYLWSLIGIASGYRGNFGTTWRWWEPFAGLLWDPVMTPALMIIGLTVFLATDRILAARPRMAGA
jgi:hypothetical protein